MAAVLEGACLSIPSVGSRNGSSSVAMPHACNQSAVKLPPYSPEATAAFASIITLMMVFTIFGNILVIIAVLTSRLLRGPQNLFLVSLAAADILVATLIIPFSLANELMGYWYFWPVWCEIYLALDVLFCTSSIAHLCAISLDRYLSVSRAVRYSLQRTPGRIKTAILVVWLISAVISFPPLLSMNKSASEAELGAGPQCRLNSERWYILYSTVGSFFAPCLIMILVYVRIYQIAKRHTRCPPGTTVPPPPAAPPMPEHNDDGAANPPKLNALAPPTVLLPPGRTLPSPTPTPAPTPTGPCPSSFTSPPPRHPAEVPPKPREGQRRKHKKSRKDNNNGGSSSSGSDGEAETGHGGGGNPGILTPPDPASRAAPSGRGLRDTVVTSSGTTLLEQHNARLEATPNTARRKAVLNREKRFTFVLAVVIGVFVICWFPFFFTYSLKAICPETCDLPEPLFKFFFWIGYCNSSLNPLIYTIFNKDFRRAFKKILCKNTKDTVF